MSPARDKNSGIKAEGLLLKRDPQLEELRVVPGREVLSERLAAKNFVTYSQSNFGLPSEVNQFLAVKYFNVIGDRSFRQEGVQGTDVLVYGRMDDKIVLASALEVVEASQRTSLTPRGLMKLPTAGDPFVEKIVSSFLQVIPDNSQKVAGTVSLKFNRVESFAARRLFQNDGDYTAIYNMKNNSSPLEVELSVDPDGLNVALSADLPEGQLLVFKSDEFFCSVRTVHNSNGKGSASQVLLMNVDSMER